MQTPYSPQTPSSAPRIGDWMSEVFTRFGRDWVAWCVQGLIYTFLPLIPLLVGGAMLVLLGIVPYYMSVSQAASNPSQSVPGAPATLPLAMVGLAVSLLITLWLLIALLAGMMHTAARQLRGEPISPGEIFRAGGAGTVLRMLGASLVVGVTVSIGLMLFVVPGVVTAGLFLFVHPLIVERRLGVGAALGESIRLTRPHLLSYTLWALLAYLLQLIGTAIPFGVIVTVPLMALMWMIAYRDATEEPLLAPAYAPVAATFPEIRPRNEG